MTEARARYRFPTVGDVPRHKAALDDQRHRRVLVVDDRPFTWAEVERATSGVAAGLARLGLAPGDVVATLLPNCAEYVELMYGVGRAGCVISPLNSRSTAREVEYGVTFAEARVLVACSEHADTVKRILATVGTLDESRVFMVGTEEPAIGRPYRELLDLEGQAPDVEIDQDAVYWMPFTSGTTGHPKAAMVTHRALVEHWHIVAHEFELTRSDTMLIAGPFYHSLGFLFGLSGLFAGGRVVIQSAFEPSSVFRAIEDHGVTTTPMVPTMYTMLLGHPDRDAHDVQSMRKVVSAGSPLLTGTKNGLLKLFPHADLYEFYGSTEVGVATLLRPEYQRDRIRSVGQPVLGTELRLLDEDGNEVGPGEVGEVHKRGALLGASYFKNPEATAASFKGDWMATGDLGRYDDDGFLYIVDRAKDMIITGGANVFPSEIEEIISKVAGVLEVAVIGVPDETWGESIKAVVVAEPGASPSTGDILAACEEHLADYKKPRSVDFVDELPKTGTGKIRKRDLRDRYWEESEAQVH